MARPEREQSGIETGEDVSELFHALANEYRRAVVQSLDATHTPILSDALATYVAKAVFPDRERVDFMAFRDRALVKLHHIHLPLLVNAGIIGIDDGQITPEARFAEAVTLVEAIP